MPVEDLPTLRARFAERLQAVEGSEDALKAAEAALAAARDAYSAAAGGLTAGRRAAGDRDSPRRWGNWRPCKLEKAKFRVAVTDLPEDKAGAAGLDRVTFEIATVPDSAIKRRSPRAASSPASRWR